MSSATMSPTMIDTTEHESAVHFYDDLPALVLQAQQEDARCVDLGTFDYPDNASDNPDACAEREQVVYQIALSKLDELGIDTSNVEIRVSEQKPGQITAYDLPDSRERESIRLLTSAIAHLDATEEERQALDQILDGEGLGGREYNAVTPGGAQAIAEERLAWLREMRSEQDLDSEAREGGPDATDLQ